MAKWAMNELYLQGKFILSMGYSVPQNKELMRIFRDLGMVERLGSCVQCILVHYPRAIYYFTAEFYSAGVAFY